MKKIEYMGMSPEKFHEIVGALYVELGLLDSQYAVVKTNFDRLAGAPRKAFENNRDPEHSVVSWLRCFKDSVGVYIWRLNSMLEALPTEPQLLEYANDMEDNE